MLNILIINNQEWVIETCNEELFAEGYKVSVADDYADISRVVTARFILVTEQP